MPAPEPPAQRAVSETAGRLELAMLHHALAQFPVARVIQLGADLLGHDQLVQPHAGDFSLVEVVCHFFPISISVFEMTLPVSAIFCDGVSGDKNCCDDRNSSD